MDWSALQGVRFGRLVVVGSGAMRNGKRHLDCVCDCGKPAYVDAWKLRAGKTQSCGCMHREMMLKRNQELKTHGRTGSPTYRSWLSMKSRCTNADAAKYANYGGRGITVCDRWMTFENFLADMGERPPRMSIDRIDVNGNYEPSNCRWATNVEQCRNMRRNRVLSCGGVSATVAEWAERTGINYFTICSRLRKGWSVERALNRPEQCPAYAEHLTETEE